MRFGITAWFRNSARVCLVFALGVRFGFVRFGLTFSMFICTRMVTAWFRISAGALSVFVSGLRPGFAMITAWLHISARARLVFASGLRLGFAVLQGMSWCLLWDYGVVSQLCRGSFGVCFGITVWFCLFWDNLWYVHI